ncbi:MAG: class I SAM-dependent methyltransferase [Planctomycetales bacterium]|nr:class I SAM-dependent methyltransferase [Planctomycetales bacterium]
MLNLISLLPVVVGQALLPQTLERTPEKGTMDSAESVEQYNGVDQSKLAIVYAAVLERIHRMRRVTEGGQAIDLCCGPGHFTLLLARYFDFERIVGVDLSEPMIEKARERAEEAGLSSRVHFTVGDATHVHYPTGSFDVVTCNDAAHHMPDLGMVEKLFLEMERLSSGKGICILSDLVRLKSESITNRYTSVIGRDYPKHFYTDFCNSMRAAWRPDELASILPKTQQKRWQHESQSILPIVQYAYGVPYDDHPFFQQRVSMWNNNSHPVPQNMIAKRKIYRTLFGVRSR